MGYYYNPPPPRNEAARPLLPMSYAGAQAGNRAAPPSDTSCFPETDKCCGLSSQVVVLSLAGAAAVAIVVSLIVLIAVDAS